MLLEIEHRFHFQYDAYISESWMELRMEPQTRPNQNVLSFFLAVGPPAKVFRYEDWLGNHVHHFAVLDYHDRIEVLARSLVETRPAVHRLEDLQHPADQTPPPGEVRDFLAFDGPIVRSKTLANLEKRIPAPPTANVGEQALAIGKLVYELFEYQADVTTYRSTTDDAIDHKKGVCQDFAQVMLALLRLRSIPCRYVSGYLHVPHLGRPAESHAWVEVWSPTAGWVGWDPTHDCPPDERHVIVATGRHYDDVPPNRGIYRGSATEALTAEVRSVESDPATARAALRESIGSIEVPVYHEVPLVATAHHNDQRLPDEQQQQQQQQQQQSRQDH